MAELCFPMDKMTLKIFLLYCFFPTIMKVVFLLIILKIQIKNRTIYIGRKMTCNSYAILRNWLIPSIFKFKKNLKYIYVYI